MNIKISKDNISFNPPNKYRVHPDSNVCSVVAVAQALDISFDEAYERLARTGKRYHRLMNAGAIVNKVLSHVFDIHVTKQTKEEKPTVFDVVSSVVNANLDHIVPYIVLTDTHIFYAEDGVIFDGVIGLDEKFHYPSQKEKQQWLDDRVDAVWVMKKNDINDITRYDPSLEYFTEICTINGIYGIYFPKPLNETLMLDMLHLYDVTDTAISAIHISKERVLNPVGYFITLDDIQFDEDGRYKLIPENNWLYGVGLNITLLEYLHRYNLRHNKE